VEAVAEGRSLTEGSGPWTVTILEDANRRCGGKWHEILLPLRALAQERLSPHAGEPCKGDTMVLVPPGGATVAETARYLLGHVGQYRAANPSCWGRIAQAIDAPVSPVVLSADEEGYVLDGLHRLVAWQLAGRLDTDGTIRVFVAGWAPRMSAMMKPYPTQTHNRTT
jgi:hypothetical protein